MKLLGADMEYIWLYAPLNFYDCHFCYFRATFFSHFLENTFSRSSRIFVLFILLDLSKNVDHSLSLRCFHGVSLWQTNDNRRIELNFDNLISLTSSAQCVCGRMNRIFIINFEFKRFSTQTPRFD